MKKIIRLTESDLKNIIKETLETMLKKPGGDFNYVNESSSVSSLKKKMINKIYKNVTPLISSIYKDDNWQQVNKVLSAVESVVEPFNGELNVWCENGGYWKRIDEFPNYKEYKLSITFADDLIINGSLKCHSAGTMEDPFDRYDITLTLW